MSITVHSKSACVQCNATYRTLDKLDFPYDTVDLEKDPETLERLKALGFAQAPIVEVHVPGEDEPRIWSGHKPDDIKNAVKALRAE